MVFGLLCVNALRAEDWMNVQVIGCGPGVILAHDKSISKPVRERERERQGDGGEKDK